LTVVRALALYRLSFCGLIIVASIVTLASDHADHAHLLAGPEIVGASLLLWRRSEIAGACILLLVFATAETFSALNGQWTTHFLHYAASVMFIVFVSRSLSIRREHNGPSTNENH
jgi:hypothetical protein